MRGHYIHNMDILRLSVTGLAFATVVFILTTSWTVFNSQVDHGSCRKLLESARDIKEAISNLNIDDDKLFNDLIPVSGQRSELLRAILASSIDISNPQPPVAEELFNNSIHGSDNFEYANLTNKRHASVELKDMRDKKTFTMCVFGGNPKTNSKLSRDIDCNEPNVTVRLVHSTRIADVDAANVTFFTNTLQKFGWWSALLSARKTHQRWALSSVYPPTTVGKDTAAPKAFRSTIFHWTATYNYASDVPLLFGKYTSFEDDSARPTGSPSLPKLQDKKKLIAFITTDCTPAKWPRETFVAKLKMYIDIDVFSCNDCGEDCQIGLKQYKFILALEDAPCYGYITDVFWSALSVYESIPIVWGATSQDYKHMAPTNSFIDITNHGSIQELATYIKDINSNSTEYDKFHMWRHGGRAEVLMQRRDLENIPSDSQVCSTFVKYIHNYNELVSYRDTNRDAWLGSCVIRPTDIMDDLPIPDKPKGLIKKKTHEW